MTDSTIAALSLILRDNFPGAGQVDQRVQPIDLRTLGTAGGHNVATPMFPVGTRIQVYNDGATGQKGWGKLMYAQLAAQDASYPAAVGFLAVPKSSGAWWQLSADKDSVLSHQAGMMAVMLSAMTTGYYGWFWVEGVCPSDVIVALATALVKTDGAVTANALLTTKAGTESAAGSIALGLALEVDSTGAWKRDVGMALVQDT